MAFFPHLCVIIHNSEVKTVLFLFFIFISKIDTMIQTLCCVAPNSDVLLFFSLFVLNQQNFNISENIFSLSHYPLMNIEDGKKSSLFISN